MEKRLVASPSILALIFLGHRRRIRVLILSQAGPRPSPAIGEMPPSRLARGIRERCALDVVFPAMEATQFKKRSVDMSGASTSTATLTHVSMNDESNVRYWTQSFGCGADELAASVARVGTSPDAVRREVYRHWAYGTFPKTEVPRRRRGRPRKRG